MDGNEALIQRARQLDVEGRAVLTDLGRVSVLAAIGEPYLVGSMAMGLMVDRDIDFNILVDSVGRADLDRAFGAMRRIVLHPRVSRLRFASQLGQFNPTGSRVEEGFYFGIHYQTDAGEHCTIDTWALQPPRPELELVARMNHALNPDMRLAILRLKHELKSGQLVATPPVHSRHIYEAALDGVRDLPGLLVWLEERNLLD